MCNYLSGELYKFRKSVGYKVCLIIMIVLSSITLCIYGAAIHMSKGKAEFFNAYNTLRSCCGGQTIFNMIGIFTGIFIASEHTNKTIRQITSKGIPRWKIYLGKFITIMIALSGLFMASVIVEFGIGGFMFGMGEAPSDITTFYIRYIITSLIMIFVYSAIAMFVATITKSLGWTIAITILAGVIMGIVSPIMMAVSAMTESENLKRVLEAINIYWFQNTPTYMLGEGVKILDYVKYLIGLSLYGIFTLAGGCLIFEKQEF